MSTLVERIKEKCKENNLTFKALELELGFGNGNIRRWDTQKPSYDKIIAVAEKLNVSFNWLIFGKESDDLTQNEQKLIDLYRKTNDIGQPLTMKHAEDVQQALPRVDQTQEQRSLNSQIG